MRRSFARSTYPCLLCGTLLMLLLVAAMPFSCTGCAVTLRNNNASGSSNGTLCGHAAAEFQLLLHTTQTADVRKVSTSTSTGTLNASQVPSMTPLVGRVVNRVDDDIMLEGCRFVGDAVNTVVGNQTACCAAEHLMLRVDAARVAMLAQMVLWRLSSVVLVDFLPTVPIVLPNSSYHACPVAYDMQLWRFDSPTVNFGIVVTALPHQGPLWEAVPMWALPCAWDTRNRPVVVMLNVNPMWLHGEGSDVVVMQEMQHHLLHALGFAASLAATSPHRQDVQTAWEPKLSKQVVYWAPPSIDPLLVSCNTGVPLDDELHVSELGAYPNLLRPSTFAAGSLWGSHYETRVMSNHRDCMGAGEDMRHSWNVSRLTQQLFQSRLGAQGLTLAAAPLPAVLDAQGFLDDALFALYLMVAGNGTAAAALAYVARIAPPAVEYTALGTTTALDCALIQAPCVQPDAEQRQASFCLPTFTLGSAASSCTPDYRGFMDCTSALSTTSTSSLPEAYRYNISGRALAGRSAYADYCPMVSTAVLASVIPCETAQVDIPLRGNNYSSLSRCVESNVTTVGPRPATVAALRCFRMRCPYGVRVELQMNGSTAWVPCPPTGKSGVVQVDGYDAAFTGSVLCAAALDVCGASGGASGNVSAHGDVAWTPAIDAASAFSTVDGYAVEYIVEGKSTFTRTQAQRICAQYAPVAALGFVPDNAFARTVADAVSATVTGLWMGASSSSGSWESRHERYSMSAVVLPPPSGNASLCYYLNLTAVRLEASSIVALLPCEHLLPALCTRSWSSSNPVVAFPSCPRGTRCSPTSLQANATLHRSYFLAVDAANATATVFSQSRAAALCTAMFALAQLFDLNNLTSLGVPLTTPASLAPWYQALFSANTILQPYLVAMWTGLRWTSNSTTPPWASLVKNFPSQVSGAGEAYCFLLVPPGTSFLPLRAVRDCNAHFPGLCYTQNPMLPIALPGYNFKFYLNHVPVAFTRVSQPTFCSGVASNGFLSPMVDQGLLSTVTAWYSSVARAPDTEWLFASGLRSAVSPLLMGATLVVNATGATAVLSFSFENATASGQLTPGAVRRFVPNSTASVLYGADTGGSFAVLQNGTTTTTLRTGALAQEGAYVCAAPHEQTAAAQWVSSCGTNATVFCDVLQQADAAFALRPERIAHDDGVTRCTGLGALPVLQPSANVSSFTAFNLTIAAVSIGYKALLQEHLFWTGVKVVNGAFVIATTSGGTFGNTYATVATASSAASMFDQFDAESLGEGVCIAAYLHHPATSASTTAVRFKGVDCRQILYFPCKKPFLASPAAFAPWVKTRNSAIATIAQVMPFHEFAVINETKSFADARRACQGQHAALAWFPNSVDDTNASAVVDAIGNIAVHPSLPSVSGKMWMGFSDRLTSTIRTVFDAFGIKTTLNDPIGESQTSKCYTLTSGTLTLQAESDCAVARSFVCMRPLPMMEVKMVPTYVMVNAFVDVTVIYPPVITPTPASSVRTSVGFATNMTPSIGISLSAPTVRLLPTAFVQSVTEQVSFVASNATQFFTPFPLQLFGLALGSCCGIRAVGMVANSVFDVFPVPLLEMSAASASGPFSAAYQTVVVNASTTQTTLYFRIAAVPPRLLISIHVRLVASQRGGMRPPSSILQNTDRTMQFQQNVSAPPTDWGGHGSTVVAVPLQTTGSGGYVQLVWQLTACNTTGICTTPGTEQLIAMLVVVVPPPVAQWTLSSALPYVHSIWSLPLAFSIVIPMLPLGAERVVATLSTNCSHAQLSPTTLVFTSTSLSALGVQMASGVAGTCLVQAVVALVAVLDGTGTSPTGTVLPLASGGSVVHVGDVRFSDTSASYYTAVVDPPYLNVYSGEALKVNITRNIIGPSSTLNDVRVTLSVAPFDVLTLVTSEVRLSVAERTSAFVVHALNVTSSIAAVLAAANMTTTANAGKEYSVLASLAFLELSSGGPGVALPILLPPLQIVVRKVFRVRSTPSVLPTGAQTAHSIVVMSLPQAPIQTVNITTVCVYPSLPSYSFSASTTVGPSMQLSRRSNDVLLLEIALVPPDAYTDDSMLAFNTTWTCSFLVSGDGSDVSTSVPGFTVSVIKRGRASLAFGATLLRPNRTYDLTVSIQSNRLLRRVASVLPLQLPLNGTVVSLTQISQTTAASSTDPDTTLTECLLRLVVPLGAATDTGVVLSLSLNDTTWFRSPARRTLELAPLVEVSAVPTSSTFSLAQPVDEASAQSIGLHLSIMPREGAISAVCFTVPAALGGTPLASFLPQAATWPKSSSTVANSSQTTIAIQMVGVVPNVIFKLSCTVTSAAGELYASPSTAVTVPMLGGSSMQFVPLLFISASIPSFPGILFVGTENARRVFVHISTLPSQNVTIAFSIESDGTGGTVPRKDPQSCLQLSPSTVTFAAVGGGDVTQVLNISATCDTSTASASTDGSTAVILSNFANITLLGTVATAAKNVDTTSSAAKKALSINFPVLPRRLTVLAHKSTNQVLSSVTVYCGGAETASTVLVNVSALPLSTTSTAIVSLSVPPLLREAASNVYATPASLQFSKQLAESLSRVWALTCSSTYFSASRSSLSEDRHVVSLDVDAPPEFQMPGPSVLLILKRLLGANVSMPTDITVASLLISLLISPEALPDDGQTLVVEFVSSCSQAIGLQHGNTITWTPGMADSQQALRVITSAPVLNCVVALELSAQSSARNYVPTLFRSTVNVYGPSSITWKAYGVSTGRPSIFSDDVNAAEGVLLYATVDQSNSFKEHVMYPRPLLGATAFTNVTDFIRYVSTLPNVSSSTAVYVFSNVPDSESSGLLGILLAEPSAMRCVRHSAAQPNVLNVTIDAREKMLTPSQDEVITLVFTQHALSRDDAPLSTSGTNISIYVAASSNPLSDTRETMYTVAYVTAAVAALFSGPSLATRAIHTSAILDIVSCPNTNWRTQKSNAMLGIVNPIPLSIGGDEQRLGRYLSAAVYGVMLVVILTILHVVAMFLVYARRLDMHTKADASTGVAMATLRFPSLELFPAMYIVGVVVHCALKVVVYSDDSSYKGGGIVLLVLVGLGIPSLMGYFSFVKASPVVFQDGDVAHSAFSTLFRAQGRWATDPVVLTIANEELRNSFQRYIAKYGMLFEDLFGSLHTDEISRTMSRLTSSGHHQAHRMEVMQAATQLEDKKMQRDSRMNGHEAEEHRESLIPLLRGRYSRHFYTFDVVHSMFVAAATVFEPSSTSGCQVQCWILLALMSIPVLLFAVVRPYRRHIGNVLLFLMALMETLAVAAKLIAISNDTPLLFTQDMVNGCLVVVASLIFIKVVVDSVFALFQLLEFTARKGYKLGSRVLGALGDGDEYQQDHVIEVDEDVPLKELLIDFVPEELIDLSANEQLTSRVDAEWQDVDEAVRSTEVVPPTFAGRQRSNTRVSHSSTEGFTL